MHCSVGALSKESEPRLRAWCLLSMKLFGTICCTKLSRRKCIYFYVECRDEGKKQTFPGHKTIIRNGSIFVIYDEYGVPSSQLCIPLCIGACSTINSENGFHCIDAPKFDGYWGALMGCFWFGRHWVVLVRTKIFMSNELAEASRHFGLLVWKKAIYNGDPQACSSSSMT